MTQDLYHYSLWPILWSFSWINNSSTLSAVRLCVDWLLFWSDFRTTAFQKELRRLFGGHPYHARDNPPRLGSRTSYPDEGWGYRQIFITHVIGLNNSWTTTDEPSCTPPSPFPWREYKISTMWCEERHETIIELASMLYFTRPVSTTRLRIIIKEGTFQTHMRHE
jgi:hypothetical protein